MDVAREAVVALSQAVVEQRVSATVIRRRATRPESDPSSAAGAASSAPFVSLAERPPALMQLNDVSPVRCDLQAGAQSGVSAPAPDSAPVHRRTIRRVIERPAVAESRERKFRPKSARGQKRLLPLQREAKTTDITTARASKRVVRVSDVVTVADLARAMSIKASAVIRTLLDNGVRAGVNDALDLDTASLLAAEFGYSIENVAFDAEQALETGHGAPSDGARLLPRPPVVTVMGHVDHGKTSLLDSIRRSHVAAVEAGGITQHIGAYSVGVSGRRVTFLDTPGHEAFTAMRARGAQVTDIVVLVVAADDGVMPQTVEAIGHARAADVPIIVALNKVDKPEARPDRVTQALADHGLVPEEWGGDTISVPVSAVTGQGIPQLLEMVLLQAELLELRANADKLARGTIVEARLDRGRGPLATAIVQEGTLRVGDPIVCGVTHGRVRAMLDHDGRTVDAALPSTPVEIVGLRAVPEAGSAFVAVADEATAVQVAEHRRAKQRESAMIKTATVSLEDFSRRLQAGEGKRLRVVLKADVQGSVEALAHALRRLSTDEVGVDVIHAAVGRICESDVLLARASKAIIVGFGVRPDAAANDLARREGTEVRLYTVIYDAVNDVRAALEGLLAPALQQRIIGRAEVRQVFTIKSLGTFAGAMVVEGEIVRGAAARLIRDHVVVHDSRVGSLRRFKDDVRQVGSTYECGIGLGNWRDIRVGDVIETYEVEAAARRLSSAASAR